MSRAFIGRIGAWPMLEPTVPLFQAENDKTKCVTLSSFISQFYVETSYPEQRQVELGDKDGGG